MIVSQTLFWMNLAVLKITESRVLSCEVPSTGLPSPYLPGKLLTPRGQFQKASGFSPQCWFLDIFPPTYSVMALKNSKSVIPKCVFLIQTFTLSLNSIQ